MRLFSIAAGCAAILAVSVASLGPVAAADKPASAEAQVKSDLYVNALETWDMMKADASVILVDVRDPVEAMFTGFAAATHIHVPLKTVDPTRFNAEKGVYALGENANFTAEVEQRLAALGADKEKTKVVFMCRSGSTRSAPAADLLFERGWKQVYTMTDGFEGDTLKDGPSKGVRAVNGWRNAGLPWSYKLPPEVAYGGK